MRRNAENENAAPWYLNKAYIFNIIYWVCLISFITRVILLSWVEEDAFITFRVVDNFVNGFGLRYNINERVQGYTNPLWMFLHIPLYAITNNIVLTTSMLGWACLIGTLTAVHFTFSISPTRQLALFLVPLILSTTQTLFFTSGLENPLLNFLFSCFGFVLIRRPRHFWFWLSLITAMSMFARLDTVILYAPIWLMLLRQYRSIIAWRELFLGTVPIAGWLIFSLFYYGFFLPNTAYAKLGSGLPVTDYLLSALAYSLDFINADPWSALLLVSSMLYFPFKEWKDDKKNATEDKIAAAIAIGIGCYCCYIFRIGAYHLGLRMYALPSLAAFWLWRWKFPVMSDIFFAGLAIAGIIITAIFGMSAEARFDVSLVRREQIGTVAWGQNLFYRSGTGLFNYNVSQPFLANHDVQPIQVFVNVVMGQPRFAEGPYKIVIDSFGLTDPLLARLPAATKHMERVGFIYREIPKGYIEAVKTSSTREMAPKLAEYYEKLRLITQGDLWDSKRLLTIFYFNAGAYNYIINEYLHEMYPQKY